MLGNLGIILIIGAIIVLGLIASFVWYLYMKVRYKTVPSNEALIVTGPNLGDESKEENIYKDNQGRYMKVIRGGGHKLKMFQTGTRVSLTSFQLLIKTPRVITQKGVAVYGEAVATIKVADSLQGIVQYAEQFLGKDQDDIENEIAEVLNSNLRAILSQMTVENINGNREEFNEKVRKVAQKQLDLMGFHITSLGLSDLSDDEGYLENLGRPRIAEVRKTAEIAEAESKRETEIKQAEVDEAVSREQYEREMNIADIRKEKDLKAAKILAETEREKANAEASYELTKEEQQLTIEQRRLEIKEQEKTNELKIRQMERENEVKLEQQQVEVRKQQAEADYYARVKESEALAKARIAEGDAEVEVIRKKALAEAEAIEKRSAALAKHKDTILLEKLIDTLPEFAKAVSEPLSNVESIRILDNGNGNQVSSLSQNVTGTMAKLQESLGQMTGFDLNGLLKNITGSKSENVQPASDLDTELNATHSNDKPSEWESEDSTSKDPFDI